MQNDVTLTTPTNGPEPHRVRDGRVRHGAGLLSLVQNLIAFGQALIRSLQAMPAAVVTTDLAGRFGSRNLAVIIARITRGLMLASALEERLVNGVSRLSTLQLRPATRSASSRKQAVRVPELSHQEDDAALLARLPTSQEIAARLRGKPIGVVLTEICHDLGITCEHALWGDLQKAILANGGSIPEVLNDMMLRVRADYVAPFAVPPMPHPVPAAPSFALTATGPP